MDPNDWRLTSPGAGLAGRVFRWSVWWPYRDGWDHDHCEFCWSEISDRPIDGHVEHNSGWVTAGDNYHWVCAECFRDLADHFDLRTQRDDSN